MRKKLAHSPALDFAEYTLYPVPLIGGALCLALGLWLFHRSHVDLGRNWSITLEVREKHQLITRGIYRWVRHPMYVSQALIGVGAPLTLGSRAVLLLAVPALAVLALRIWREEDALARTYPEYSRYAARTKRVLPFVY